MPGFRSELPRLFVLSLLLASPLATAQLPVEQLGVAKMPPPQDDWLMVGAWKTGHYVVDGGTGQVMGLLQHYMFTPAVVTMPERGEAYHVDSFVSRRYTGERQDVVVIVDLETLTTKAEIDIPDKAAGLPHRGHIGLLGDQRHLVVYNLTPAQSVSIVDIVDREFDSEISTPGCAIILPVEQRAFLMICADGALQLIEVDESGKEARRARSESFFEPDVDPVFAHNILTADGWLLVSHDGRAWRVSVRKGEVSVSQPLDLLDADDHEQSWRPGGRQPFSVHRPSNRLYVLMHQGGVDTHAQPGTEVWVYDLATMRRVKRALLEPSGSSLLVSQEAVPSLYVMNNSGELRIFDAQDLRLLRQVGDLGGGEGQLQLLAPHD